MMARIGPEYETSGTPTSQQDWRACFFRHVDELVPDVLARLRADVMPVYAETVAGHLDCPSCASWRDWHRSAAILDMPRVADAVPHLVPLVNALRQWSEDHGFADGWMRDVAVETMHWWWLRGDTADGWQLHLRGVVSFDPDSDDAPPAIAPLVLPPCDPLQQSLDEYETMARGMLAAHLREHRRAVQEWATGHPELQRPPAKRDRTRHGVDVHVAWLVLWQVSRWTRPAIANKYNVGKRTRGATRIVHSGTSSIADGVQSAADLIGLKNLR
jgi:hypothetical protein